MLLDRAVPPRAGFAGLTPTLFPVLDRPDRRPRAAHRLAAALAAAPRRLCEGAGAIVDDLGEALAIESRFVALHHGAVPMTAARSVAALVHDGTRAEVGAMVLDQVAQLRALGFAVVVISSAPLVPGAALDRLRAQASLVVQRRAHGFEFGAWRDVLPLLVRPAPAMRELMLLDGRMCGPLRPLAPALKAMRGAGDGFYGLTESLAPQPHLQSHLLLLRGQSVLEELMTFLGRHRPTASRRRSDLRGAVALTAWMRDRGHSVAVWCGYEAVEQAALRCPAARARLRAAMPALFAGVAPGSAAEAAGMAIALRRHPVDPTALFWRELVEEFGYPFIRADLLRRDHPGRAQAPDWRSLVLPGDDAGAHRIAAHLCAEAAPA